LAGEKAVQEIGQDYFIFRTSWLYSTRRDCFVTKVLKWSRTKAELKIVTDQIGSPTWARTLADTTAEAIQGMHSKGRSWVRQKSGIYHLAGNGSASRFEWANKILEFDPRKDEHVLTRIQEAKSQDFKNGAQRPNFSALDCALFQNTFDLFYTDWLMDLKQALTQ
ncbi:MAG: dTDP-4-dehydrorhamnose reductase, partial [Anaerolineales bacterium]